MKKATLSFSNVNWGASHIHKFRGFIGNLFKNHDLIHNHDLKTGKPIYRYPLICAEILMHKGLRKPQAYPWIC
jgi:hypothetical protein